MTERVWNVVRDSRSPDAWRYVACEFERVPMRGRWVWQLVRRLAPPRPAKWSAETDGEESGLPRDESAGAGRASWRLSDYFEDFELAAARLGAFSVVLAARSNQKTWTVAICTRTPPHTGPLVVRAHIGTRQDMTSVGRALGISTVFCTKVPRKSGERALTEADERAAREQRARDKRARMLQRVRRANAKHARKQQRIAEAEQSGDADAIAKAKTGKSKTTRERAARRAARTRKRRAREFAKRSRAAKKAAATRRENAEKRARRSEAARLAWQKRKAQQTEIEQ